MHRRFALLATIFSMVLVLSLTACSSAPTPTAVVQEPTAAPTSTSTPAPTVSIPTATHTATQGLPTRTPTRVVKPPTATRPPTTPSPTPYVVKKGDTLLAVAGEFGLSTEALASANALDEEELLQIGQELVIPATPTPTPTPTPIGAQATDSVASAPPPPPPTPTPSGPPIPTVTHPPGINPLTGLPVPDPAVLKRRPLMVRLGNDVGARPQRGLNKADMVYEEIVEWWTTRFTAIYLSETPELLGPIRSVRLINLQLVPQYGGALAHSGGSDPVRWEVSQSTLTDLDQFFNPDPYQHLPNEGWQTRAVFNAQVARAYMVKKRLEKAVPLQGFLFSDTIESGEPGPNIYIYYPRSTCFTEWHYDDTSGKYLRWIIGSPLLDAIDGKQINADNVIVYFADHQDTDIIEDTNGATSVRIIVNGKGPAMFFRDGKMNKGFWQTDGTRTPFFTLEDGNPYSLKPGNTWVEVVPTYYVIGINSADEASSKPN
jgi:LysM repeat protein